MSDTLDKVAELLSMSHAYPGSVWGICPFHTDSRPSLMVHEDWYECVACGAKGRTEKLLSILNAPTYRAQPLIKSEITNPFFRWLRKSSLDTIMTIAWKQNKEHGGSAYLIRRGIPFEYQRKLGIGVLDGWITFPICDVDKHLLGGVVRIADPEHTSMRYAVPNKQNPNLVYVPSWKAIHNSDTVYMTFGILDAVSIIISGHAAVSTTNGKRLNDISALENIRKRIILLPDRGEEMQAKSLASRLGWRGAVLKIEYPDDSKDPNDLLRYHPEYLKELLSCPKHG